MADRATFLKRIRHALGREAANVDPGPASARTLPEPRVRDLMPAVEPGKLVEKFEEELRKVGGEALRAANRSELETLLKRLTLNAGAKSIVLSRNPLLSGLGLAPLLRAWGLSVAEWPAEAPGKARGEFREAAFEAGVGITGLEFALAESGSLVLTSRTEGSQLTSLAPPVHVALYRRGQVVESLDDVLERLAPGAGTAPDGRSIVFVTGPSRTADIEQILVRGVHGPRDVFAILVEEQCMDSKG